MTSVLIIWICVLIAAIGGGLFFTGALTFFGALKICRDDSTSRTIGIIILVVGLFVIFTAAALAPS
jgi:hypothetical protein